MTDIPKLRAYDVVLIAFILLASAKLIQYLLYRPTSRLATLRGPSNTSILFGRSTEIIKSFDRSAVYEQWANQYGAVYKIPTAMGGTRVVICDPKAMSHILAKDTYTYVGVPLFRKLMTKFFGPNMLVSEGDDHKRQRRTTSPAFSNAALSGVTSVFYDSTYKVKACWDALLESNSEVTIEIHQWLNRITLDSIGIAGFGHDFKSIDGEQSPVLEAFSAFGGAGTGFISRLTFALGALFPQVVNLPIKRMRLFAKLNEVTTEIANELFDNSRSEKQGSDSSGDMKDRSIIGMLVKGESSDTDLKLTRDEVVAQNLFLLAGYETTAVGLSWSLVELARNPQIQHKLREELRQFALGDPSWEQLRSELPYLDAFVHEILRMHPPLEESSRLAAEDDVVPLSSPIPTASGQLIDSLFIPKGTIIGLPLMFFNRSEAFWGPDSRQFDPERWLNDLSYPAKDLHGYRHLYTFSDGQRMCLGRGFALAELKASLSVLVRNFSFELLEGPDTKLGKHVAILPRPKLEGASGAFLPMRIRQVV